MKIQQVSFRGNIPNEAKSSVVDNRFTVTAPQKDSVEISTKEKDNTVKYALFGAGLLAAVILIAKHKSIAKIFSKTKDAADDAKNLETKVDTLVDSSSAKIDDVPTVKENPPVEKPIVKPEEIKLPSAVFDFYPESVESLFKSVEGKDVTDDLYYKASQSFSKLCKDLTEHNPDSKFKNFLKKDLLGENAPVESDNKLFVEKMIKNKADFMEEFLGHVKKERTVFAEKITKLIEHEDKETNIKAIESLVTSGIKVEDYPTDFVDRILKKENSEELIRTFFDKIPKRSESRKIDIARKFLEKTDNNYTAETRLSLFHELAKSTEDEKVDLNSILTLYKDPKFDRQSELNDVIKRFGDSSSIEKIRPYFESSNASYHLYILTKEIGTPEQHKEFVTMYLNSPDKNKVLSMLQNIDNFVEDGGSLEVQKMDMDLVKPFLKYDPSNEKIDNEILQKTILAMTYHGDRETYKLVTDFYEKTPNLPSEVKQTFLTGMGDRIKKDSLTKTAN